jgi:hypothetical protein
MIERHFAGRVFQLYTDRETFVVGIGWSWGRGAVEISFACWSLVVYYRNREKLDAFVRLV